MTLPVLVSVPHTGNRIPPELDEICILNKEEIVNGSDQGAEEIYYPLKNQVQEFITTDIARVLVDLNRAPEDIGFNGVIKNYTFNHEPIYKKFPDGPLIRLLLERYYFPYHIRLTEGAANKSLRLGIDCHTMSSVGPPVGPDPGLQRPLVCLSNNNGTCPKEWIEAMAKSFENAFRETVYINKPFRGGYIIESHASEMPWIQIEISQTDKLSYEFKRDCLLKGLQNFCTTLT